MIYLVVYLYVRTGMLLASTSEVQRSCNAFLRGIGEIEANCCRVNSLCSDTETPRAHAGQTAVVANASMRKSMDPDRTLQVHADKCLSRSYRGHVDCFSRRYYDVQRGKFEVSISKAFTPRVSNKPTRGYRLTSAASRQLPHKRAHRHHRPGCGHGPSLFF